MCKIASTHSDRLHQDDHQFLGGVTSLLEETRRSSARAVNSIMTSTYWEIARRVVFTEQKGTARAQYGQQLISRLSADLR